MQLNALDATVGGKREVFVGAITATLVDVAPTGWLLCNGAEVSRSTFSALFAVIGTKGGPGNGSTTFNVPDLRGRVPVGVDGTAGRLVSNNALGNSGGADRHKLTVNELASHEHGADAHQFALWRAGDVQANTTPGVGTDLPIFNTSFTTAHAGGDQPHNNMQPYLIVNYFIRH